MQNIFSFITVGNPLEVSNFIFFYSPAVSHLNLQKHKISIA